MSGDQESKSRTLLNLAKTRRILLNSIAGWNPDHDPILEQVEAEMDALAKEIAKDGAERRNPMIAASVKRKCRGCGLPMEAWWSREECVDCIDRKLQKALESAGLKRGSDCRNQSDGGAA